MGVSTAGRHPNWVEVLDIRNKILAKKAHVLEVEGLDKVRNYNGTTMEGFTGCHSDQAFRDYVATNGGTYRINGKPTNLQADEVFEGQPIITINGKEYVKTNGQPIVEYSNGKYGGTSTFFPENWNNSKILDEVEYAIANNHGVAPGNNPSEYFGFSRDGKV
ncbi:EndoU domain-containing protein [Flavobacterium columnare]|uniref:EndoU domain-containing protein n=1 Tax=Flavobacterium columnare TaxID=996 RepID=UPI0013D7480A|nr:EndoU domain-containing protein [Flavobacterium columnare]